MCCNLYVLDFHQVMGDLGLDDATACIFLLRVPFDELLALRLRSLEDDGISFIEHMEESQADVDESH